MNKPLLVVSLLLFSTVAAQAAINTRTVTYKHKGVTMKGHLAYDDAIKGKRPGVLVVHEWWGLDEYARKRAEQLAKMGYVALAVDMYGEGKTTDHPKEASALASAVRKNIQTWLGRANAGLKVLREHELVDDKKLAAIGYCFGGSTVQQLAFSGADLAAVVSFHGALVVPSEEQVKAVKARLLICHGADDKFIPEEVVKSFKAALDAGKVKYTFESYQGAKHSFTVPNADDRKIDGLAYNAEADRRSWATMEALFKEAFTGK